MSDKSKSAWANEDDASDEDSSSGSESSSDSSDSVESDSSDESEDEADSFLDARAILTPNSPLAKASKGISSIQKSALEKDFGKGGHYDFIY